VPPILVAGIIRPSAEHLAISGSLAINVGDDGSAVCGTEGKSRGVSLSPAASEGTIMLLRSASRDELLKQFHLLWGAT
jgi:hypothetical protein